MSVLRKSSGKCREKVKCRYIVCPGPQGARGEDGPPGPQGSQGVQGSQGPQGGQGAQGPQGPQGVPGGGPQGATGATGTQGPQGGSPTGAQGNTGVQGAQGEAGSQGATGAVGPQGTQGPQGATGEAGPQGTQGAQGAQGMNPRGAQGAQGVTGETGPQGTQGATGEAGAHGTQGALGPQGPQGAQGAIGLPGLRFNYEVQSAPYSITSGRNSVPVVNMTMNVVDHTSTYADLYFTFSARVTFTAAIPAILPNVVVNIYSDNQSLISEQLYLPILPIESGYRLFSSAVYYIQNIPAAPFNIKFAVNTTSTSDTNPTIQLVVSSTDWMSALLTYR